MTKMKVVLVNTTTFVVRSILSNRQGPLSCRDMYAKVFGYFWNGDILRLLIGQRTSV